MSKYSFGEWSVSYDSLGDVMYITGMRIPVYVSIEKADGLVFRYSKDGHLIGVTVIDFMSTSDEDLHWLSLQLGANLDDMKISFFNEIKRVVSKWENTSTGQSLT